MNTTYLLVMLIVAVATFFVFKKAENNDGLLFLGIIGTFASIAMFIASFAADFGSETQTEITDFAKEKSAYCLIVHAAGKEWQFKDAHTVNDSDKIEKFILVKKHNVWGVLLEQGSNAPLLKPVFSK